MTQAVIPGCAVRRRPGIHFSQYPCGTMDSLMCNCTSKLARFTRAPE